MGVSLCSAERVKSVWESAHLSTTKNRRRRRLLGDEKTRRRGPPLQRARPRP